MVLQGESEFKQTTVVSGRRLLNKDCGFMLGELAKKFRILGSRKS